MIIHAANANSGVGGQGECLRQTILALDQFPRSRVYSRRATAEKASCVDVPVRWTTRAISGLTRGIPLLRAKRDWLTLLSDLDFDDQVQAGIDGADLFEGVMAQCCRTFRKLRPKKTRLALSCLNTHIEHLEEVLAREHRRIGFAGPAFIHPEMKRRAIEELETADVIRVLSQTAKRTFVDRGVPESKIRVIPSGVNHAHFRPVPKKDKTFRVLAVGSIEPRKGTHYLLRAFENARIPNSELVLIGDTGDRWSRRMLREFMTRNKNIIVRGMDVPTTPVEQTYGEASVLVHPALEDGFGVVIAEALASGRPVIATRQSGASELLEHGRNGFLIDAGDADQIGEYLRLLAGDPRLLETMSDAAPPAVRHKDYPDFARSLASFYREVLSGRRAAADENHP